MLYNAISDMETLQILLNESQSLRVLVLVGRPQQPGFYGTYRAPEIGGALAKIKRLNQLRSLTLHGISGFHSAEWPTILEGLSQHRQHLSPIGVTNILDALPRLEHLELFSVCKMPTHLDLGSFRITDPMLRQRQEAEDILTQHHRPLFAHPTPVLFLPVVQEMEYDMRPDLEVWSGPEPGPFAAHQFREGDPEGPPNAVDVGYDKPTKQWFLRGVAA
ncbi:uncharacterized protein EV422DRAFT_539958, partial [Fimicolochytrium jonesii]|uniref:uncharacterized protein n=1 Tax=Fimicolochytrium jonesii TaxID=1396493 RepID=UPI0022FEC366